MTQHFSVWAAQRDGVDSLRDIGSSAHRRSRFHHFRHPQSEVDLRSHGPDLWVLPRFILIIVDVDETKLMHPRPMH